MSNNKNGKTKDNNVGDKDIPNSTVNNNNKGKETANEENPYNLTGKAYEYREEESGIHSQEKQTYNFKQLWRQTQDISFRSRKD